MTTASTCGPSDGWHAGRCDLSADRRLTSSTRGVPTPTRRSGVPRSDAGLGARATWRSLTRPGAGVADDKLVYTYVPDMIRLLPRRGPRSCRTCRHGAAASPMQLEHVLANLDSLVVKPVDGSGGYGMLMGPNCQRSASATQFAAQLKAEPAQLHRAAGHHAVDRARRSSATASSRGIVDLRPFILSGTKYLRDDGRPDARGDAARAHWW